MTVDHASVLLLSEDNPQGYKPEWVLHSDLPQGGDLRRLLGISEQQYLAFGRQSLCDEVWSLAYARYRATGLLTPDSPWRVFVLIGRKVALAFEKSADTQLPWFSCRSVCHGITLVSLPKPSSRNPVWVDRSKFGQVRELMKELVPQVPWGKDPGAWT